MWLYIVDLLLEHKNRNKYNEKLLELIKDWYNSQTRDKYSHTPNNNVIEKNVNQKDSPFIIKKQNLN